MKKIIIACSLLSLFSCTRAEKEGATSVTLNLPSTWAQHEAGAVETKSVITPLSLNSSIVPANLSDLNCFAVLVGGPEAGMSDNICKYKSTSDTFTVGMALAGFTNNGASGAQLKFEVPNGKSRSIYLIGFKILTSSVVAAGSSVEKACASLIKDDSLENFISEPYLISTANEINMSGEDLAIPMTATLNSTLKIGDCKGPDFPDHGGSSGNGQPAKFAISFQDETGSITKQFRPNQCIGVRFQVQDSDGKRADMSTNPNISGRVTMNYGGSAIGTFYHTGSPFGCQAGYEMSSGSSDMTISFKNAGVAFSDFVAFFEPSGVQVPTGTLQFANNNSTSNDGSTAVPITSTSKMFYYSATTSTPMSYAIYDLYNNRSTASTTNSIPMVIRANECRVGFLQFLDSSGVPTRLNLSTGPYKNVEIAPVGTTSNLNFYASSSDCSANSAPALSTSLSMAPYSNYAMQRFNYKMAIPLSAFSFSALNAAGSSTPAISTGDLNSSSNFWRSENN